MKHLVVLTLTSCVLLFGACCNDTTSNRSITLTGSLAVEYMTVASQFYDCSLVDWDSFTNLSINQYTSDWGEEINSRIHSSWRGHDAASLYWNRLKSAKIYMHSLSLPLRSICNQRTAKELDAFERSFDEAFVTMVSQEYYLRVFQDVFDETVPVRLDKIARAFPR
jgi:hypothetical protein